MKELKPVQTIVKVARILAIIAFVCYIIGTVCSIFSLVLVNAMKNVEIDGKTFQVLLEESSKMSIETLNSAMTSSLILCVAGCVLAKMAKDLFRDELKLGTPFVETWAKRLLNLGIIEICVSVGLGIVIAIVQSIFARSGAATLDFGVSGLFSTGLFFIVFGFVCRYGAARTNNDEDIASARTDGEKYVDEEKPTKKYGEE